MAWYKDAQGKPQWIADAPAAVPVGPRDPMAPIKVQGGILGNSQTAAQTGRTVVQTRGDQIDNATKAATQAAMIAKAKADAQAAQNAAKGITPEILQQRATRLQSLPAIDSQLAEIRNIYNQYFKGAGGSSGRGRLSEIMPSKVFGVTTNSPNALLDNAGARAGALFKPMIAPGAKDADAAAEYAQKVLPFLPTHGDSDPELERKYAALYQLRNQLAGVKPKAQAQQPQSQVIDFNHWGR